MDKLLVVAAICLVLAGCAGTGMGQMAEYDFVKTQSFHDGKEEWVVMDKVESNRMMLAPPTGRGLSNAWNATSKNDGYQPDADYRRAAIAWFSKTGRSCSIINLDKAFGQSMEVFYRC